MSQKPPWQTYPLDEWNIIGMNHYYVEGRRMLFVAMGKRGKYIKEEGPDDKHLWSRLYFKAEAIEKG